MSDKRQTGPAAQAVLRLLGVAAVVVLILGGLLLTRAWDPPVDCHLNNPAKPVMVSCHPTP